MIVCILEDNLVMQHRIENMMRKWDGVEKILCVSSNKEFSELKNIDDIDLLLADLKLSDGLGVDSITLFSRINKKGICLVISSLVDGKTIMNALSSGAVGYLHKDETEESFKNKIEDAFSGNSPMSAIIANNLVTEFHTLRHQNIVVNSQEKDIKDRSQSILTKKEVEVINLISKGFTYAETAHYLEISVKTVPSHIRSIYKKLQAHNKTEAVFEARSLGILD